MATAAGGGDRGRDALVDPTTFLPQPAAQEEAFLAFYRTLPLSQPPPPPPWRPHPEYASRPVLTALRILASSPLHEASSLLHRAGTTRSTEERSAKATRALLYAVQVFYSFFIM